MIEQTLSTWQEFDEAWHKLDAERSAKLLEPHAYISEYLYRGQSDASWKLQTTLERTVDQQVSMLGYYRLLCIAKSKVETFTAKDWDIPNYGEYQQWLGTQDYLFFEGFKAFDFFVYMRHHGFPSPLLDWSESPYVAAFFAMHHIPRGAEFVSIYAYCEYSSGGKGGTVGAPSISGLNSLVKAHRRHFLQQSRYTVCTANIGENLRYASHEDVTSRNSEHQDLLWKFNLPVSERVKVLTALNKMNINSFSLFGSEESLMDTIAIGEILLRGHRFDH